MTGAYGSGGYRQGTLRLVCRKCNEAARALLRRFGAAPRSGTAYHVEPVAGAVSVVIEDGLQLERIVQAGETVLMIRRAR